MVKGLPSYKISPYQDFKLTVNLIFIAIDNNTLIITII